jgi:ankyrin repeat protein
MQHKTGTPVSALWSAAHGGDRPTISRLIVEGVDVNIWDKWGRTALLFAASTGNLEIAQDLLRAGAWVDAHEDYDVYDSPLMRAAIRGDRDMVAFLLSAGADPTRHVGVSQQTAANYARLDHPEIAALLEAAEDAKRA